MGARPALRGYRKPPDVRGVTAGAVLDAYFKSLPDTKRQPVYLRSRERQVGGRAVACEHASVHDLEARRDLDGPEALCSWQSLDGPDIDAVYASISVTPRYGFSGDSAHSHDGRRVRHRSRWEFAVVRVGRGCRSCGRDGGSWRKGCGGSAIKERKCGPRAAGSDRRYDQRRKDPTYTAAAPGRSNPIASDLRYWRSLPRLWDAHFAPSFAIGSGTDAVPVMRSLAPSPEEYRTIGRLRVMASLQCEHRACRFRYTRCT